MTSGHIDWNDLTNPMLAYPEWSIKDSCMAYRDGQWHLFFSAFDQDRSTVVQVSTPDFKTFTDFRWVLDGQDLGLIGVCSPELVYADGQYVLVVNSWGELPGRPNAMYYRVSEDLVTWSPMRPLGHDLAPDLRIIDGSLAKINRGWICICKRMRHPTVAFALTLDGPWQWVSEDPATLLGRDGEENGLIHENFQMLTIDGVPHLLSTDYQKAPKEPRVEGAPKMKKLGTNHQPWLYRLVGDPNDPQSYLSWDGGFLLAVPNESFNTLDKINAGALYDHRAVDGYFYLLYGGKNKQRRDEFAGLAAGGAALAPWLESPWTCA